MFFASHSLSCLPPRQECRVRNSLLIIDNMAPKSTKVSPAGTKAKERPAPPPPPSTNYGYALLPSSLLSLAAMCFLIVDVILGHKHTVVMCMWAGVLLLASAFANLIAQLCIFESEHNRLACQAVKDALIAIANLIALDSFLYEEENYNHWGHSENVLRQERWMGVFIEIFIAGYISTCVYRLHAKPATAMV